jgi:hypothetical protein
LISPQDEEDIEAEQDPFKVCRLVSFSPKSLPESGLSYEDLSRPSAVDVDPVQVGFDWVAMSSDEQKSREAKSKDEAVNLLGYDMNRGVVQDMIILGQQLITIKDRPLLERRALDGRIIDFVEGAFHGAQAFVLEDKRVLVNSYEPDIPYYPKPGVFGRLLIWSGESGRATTFLEGANSFLLSQSSEGTVLARACGMYSEKVSVACRQPMGVDFLIKDLKCRPVTPFGSALYYICLSTRNTKGLYFIGEEFPFKGWGTPQPRLVIREVEAGGTTRVCDLLDKRSETDPKIVGFINYERFCAYPQSSGDHLIGSGFYVKAANEPFTHAIWRHDLSGKVWLWQKEFSEAVTLLQSFPERDTIVAGFDGGILRLLDSATGEIVDETTLSFAGIPSLPVAACCNGNRILVATLESRILSFVLTSLP